jgi:hypothetical protein
MALPSTFQTIPVLTILPDEERAGRRGGWARRAESHDAPAGQYASTVMDAAGTLRHTFNFTCETRAQIDALTAFFDARRGRYEAFWFPTWLHEYSPTALALAGATVTIPRESPLPLDGLLWRYAYAAAYRPTGLALECISVTDLVAGVDDVALTFGAPRAGDQGWALNPLPTVMLGRLAYGRFATDELRVPWFGIQSAPTVTIELLELPLEAPEVAP